MPVGTAITQLILAVMVASVAPRGGAADWADPAKVLKIAFPIDISGLDPAGTQETYAFAVESRIFDALYVWDYFARPYRFVPSIATGMPEISADGRVWTIRIRRGAKGHQRRVLRNDRVEEDRVREPEERERLRRRRAHAIVAREEREQRQQVGDGHDQKSSGRSRVHTR